MENGSVKAAIEGPRPDIRHENGLSCRRKIRTAAVYTELRRLDAEAIVASRRSLPDTDRILHLSALVRDRGLRSLMPHRMTCPTTR